MCIRDSRGSAPTVTRAAPATSAPAATALPGASTVGATGAAGTVIVNGCETTAQDFCVKGGWGSVVVMVARGWLIQASVGGPGAMGGRVNRCGLAW